MSGIYIDNRDREIARERDIDLGRWMEKYLQNPKNGVVQQKQSCQIG
jgi:hypothetical protein